MAKYKVLQKSFINGAVVEEGEVIDYDPPEGTTVSENLEPVHEKHDKDKPKESEHNSESKGSGKK